MEDNRAELQHQAGVLAPLDRLIGCQSIRPHLVLRQQVRSAAAVKEFTKKLGLITGDGDDWVRVGPLKISVDGGIHWGSTRLSEPYGEKRRQFYVLEDANYRGDLAYSRELMEEIFEAGQKLGWQMCCHATGDGCVNEILSALENVNQRLPVKVWINYQTIFPIPNDVLRN